MAQNEARKVGRPPVAPVAAELHLRIPATIYDAIAVKALRRKVPVNAVIREALQQYVEQSWN